LNKFCKDCANKSVPSSVKKKFNLSYNKTFLECPLNDDKVAGCLIKERLQIDWNSFCVWLHDHKNLSAEEAVSMAKLGYLKEDFDKKKGKGRR